MTIHLEFEEADIQLLSEGLQALSYNKVASLIARLQKQIDAQVRAKKTEADETPPATD